MKKWRHRRLVVQGNFIGVLAEKSTRLLMAPAPRRAVVRSLCLLLFAIGGNQMLLRAQSTDGPGHSANASTEFGVNRSLPASVRGSVPASSTAKPEDSLSSSKSSNLMNSGAVMLAKPVPAPERFHFWPAMLQSFEY